MIGILILTLGRVGDGLLEEASLIMGEQPKQVETFQANCDQSPEIILQDLKSVISGFTNVSGVLILADIYGATHVNAACQILKHNEVELVAGVNLPMLVKVLNYRNLELDQLVETAVAGGKTGIVSPEEQNSRKTANL